jgi:hypothetical protein
MNTERLNTERPSLAALPFAAALIWHYDEHGTMNTERLNTER